MDRKHQFKRKSEAAGAMRDKRRRERRDSYKKQRDELLMGKRMKKDESEAVEAEIAEEQVIQELTGEFLKASGDCSELMKKIKNALSCGTAIIDVFLKVDGALQHLVDLLKDSTGVDTQLEAAWCLNNIAGGTEEHAKAVLGAAGDVLISVLSTGNVPLEDQCAWAIGNLAAGSVESRVVLRSKGAIDPLVALLKSSTQNVVRYAAYALSNLARDKETTNTLTEAGILPHLASHLVYEADKLDVLTEVSWVLTYLTACGTHEKEILEAGILEKLIDVVVVTAEKDEENVSVLTPLLRCLGNVICSGLDETASTACQRKELFPALDRLILSDHPHIRKECLWVLSNITAITEACNEIVSSPLLASMMKLLAATFDVKKEAAYTMCNIAAQGDKFCTALLEAGVLKAMIALFKSADVDTVHYALSFTEMILHSNKDAAKVFEDNGGLAGLEAWEYNDNTLLRSQADNILDTYFYKEEENADEDAAPPADTAAGKPDAAGDKPAPDVVAVNGAGEDN